MEPNWCDELLQLAEALRLRCPRLADLVDRWVPLAADWAAEEARRGYPGGHSARWLAQDGVPMVATALRRAQKDAALAGWLEGGVHEMTGGLWFASVMDHEEAGVWVIYFPGAIAARVREYDTGPADV